MDNKYHNNYDQRIHNIGNNHYLDEKNYHNQSKLLNNDHNNYHSMIDHLKKIIQEEADIFGFIAKITGAKWVDWDNIEKD